MIRNYIKLGPLGRVFAAEKRHVLLIDEIDKADLEFPNDILLELDEMRFYVMETGDEIIAKCLAARVPCFPFSGPAEMLALPQLEHEGRLGLEYGRVEGGTVLRVDLQLGERADRVIGPVLHAPRLRLSARRT